MELEVTWSRTAKVWWSYLWRNILAIFGAMILGGIVGFVIGFVMGALGVSFDTMQAVTTSIGAIIGLLISIIPIRLILGKDFGEFRLVLLKNESSD